MKKFDDFWDWLKKSGRKFRTLGGRTFNTAHVDGEVLIINITRTSNLHRRNQPSVRRDFHQYPPTASEAPAGDRLYVNALIWEWKESLTNIRQGGNKEEDSAVAGGNVEIWDPKELLSRYPQTVSPSSVKGIPQRVWLVYILTYNDKPIVVGHGKANRAKVIFDGRSQITSGHIKALFVRIYRLFGAGVFQTYIISCKSKDEAKQIEKELHETIGGNNRKLPADIEHALFAGFTPGTLPHMILRMALCSSFDGLSDLKLWRRKGIVDNVIWSQLSTRLGL